MNWEVQLIDIIIQFAVSLGIFIVMAYVGKFIYGKIKSSSTLKDSKFLNIEEYLPEEESTTIKQVFYLIMILIFVVNMIYIILGLREVSLNLLLLDIIVSLYVIINGDISFSKNKLAYCLVIPLASMSHLIFNNNFITFMDGFHIFVFLYLIKIYYQKFIEYTETNSLRITILFLFGIVFVSFFITMIVERTTPLNALVMVSNAFTSNGYSVLGHSKFGKINALILVWSGFLLSGVGTATLAVAIVMKYANDKFDHLEEKVKKIKKD